MILAAIVAMQMAVVPVATCQPAGSTGETRSEWMVSAGVARSVELFQSVANRTYGLQVVSWGRTLTRPRGPGVLRGCLAWAAEATPVLAQFSPSHLYGAGLAPIVWRWNFVPHRKWSAFAELSMGGLWTTAPIPEKTQSANFTAHWGGGVRIHASGGHSLVIGYRLQHLSNGNRLESNPGVNSHVLLAGWSRRSAR